jgi:hypothetical protein
MIDDEFENKKMKALDLKNEKMNFNKGNILYYKGNNLRQDNTSKEGYVIITNDEIRCNTLRIMHIDQEEVFQCEIKDLSLTCMKEKFIVNYGFEVSNALQYGTIKECKYHIFPFGTIKIYISSEYGFCATDDINTLIYDGKLNPKDFFLKNKDLNQIHDFIQFLILNGENLTELEIAKRLLKL